MHIQGLPVNQGLSSILWGPWPGGYSEWQQRWGDRDHSVADWPTLRVAATRRANQPWAAAVSLKHRQSAGVWTRRLTSTASWKKASAWQGVSVRSPTAYHRTITKGKNPVCAELLKPVLCTVCVFLYLDVYTVCLPDIVLTYKEGIFSFWKSH